MNITQRNSPNRAIGRQGHRPDFIVIHTTGGTFTSGINTIMNAANQVSYHFVISRTGEIVQAVDIQNTAWANGTRNDGGNMCNSRSTIRAVRDRRLNANVFSISIAFGDMPAGNPSVEQITAVVSLIRHIRSEVRRIYGFDIPMARSNIVGHHEITPVSRPNCPGRAFPFDDIIRRINGQAAPPAPPAATGPIRAGDTVRIAAGATYFNGGAIPAWVLGQNWIVSSVNGDRAVLGRSVSGANTINSPINTKFLTVVGSTAPPAPSAFQPYTVRVTANPLNIRSGPGTNFATNGSIRDRGIYTIVEEANGPGAARWGRLQSGAGWISLDFTERR